MRCRAAALTSRLSFTTQQRPTPPPQPRSVAAQIHDHPLIRTRRLQPRQVRSHRPKERQSQPSRYRPPTPASATPSPRFRCHAPATSRAGNPRKSPAPPGTGLRSSSRCRRRWFSGCRLHSSSGGHRLTGGHARSSRMNSFPHAVADAADSVDTECRERGDNQGFSGSAAGPMGYSESSGRRSWREGRLRECLVLGAGLLVGQRGLPGWAADWLMMVWVSSVDGCVSGRRLRVCPVGRRQWTVQPSSVADCRQLGHQFNGLQCL